MGSNKRETVKMSVKSFDELRKLIENPPPPNEALVDAMAKYNKSVVSRDGETTVLNVDLGDATMR